MFPSNVRRTFECLTDGCLRRGEKVTLEPMTWPGQPGVLYFPIPICAACGSDLWVNDPDYERSR